MQEAKVYDGQTGEVTFNSLGDRTNADYNVVNILQFGESVIGTFASESVGASVAICLTVIYLESLCHEKINFFENVCID